MVPAKRAFALLALLAGCPDRTISAVPSEQDKIEVNSFPALPHPQLDVLFVIDDSGSMEQEQASLRANFHRFVEVLEALPGGLPDVHIGVITPNMGTSALDGSMASATGTCIGRGENGQLRELPGAGVRYLLDEDDGNGGRRRNFDGTLADAFSEIANVGFDGCGIEQHLEAMKKSLDGTNAVNAGFLRKDAFLAVILIADEDDCSLQKSTIFNAPSANYGDVVNFRCTSEGIRCDVGGDDLNAPGPREECHPNFESTTIANPDRYVEFLNSLKVDPKNQIIVGGILGRPTPFGTVTKPGTNVTVLADSCRYNGQFAFPAVRTADFLSQFQFHTFQEICDGDLSKGLTAIGDAIADTVGNPCFDAALVDADPTVEGTQYDCSVVERRRLPNGQLEDVRVVPACRGDNASFCWRIEIDEAMCRFKPPPHAKLVIDRTDTPTSDLQIEASCVTGLPETPVD